MKADLSLNYPKAARMGVSPFGPQPLDLTMFRRHREQMLAEQTVASTAQKLQAKEAAPLLTNEELMALIVSLDGLTDDEIEHRLSTLRTEELEVIAAMMSEESEQDADDRAYYPADLAKDPPRKKIRRDILRSSYRPDSEGDRLYVAVHPVEVTPDPSNSEAAQAAIFSGANVRLARNFYLTREPVQTPFSDSIQESIAHRIVKHVWNKLHEQGELGLKKKKVGPSAAAASIRNQS
jgi:hypothetical protein